MIPGDALGVLRGWVDGQRANAAPRREHVRAPYLHYCEEHISQGAESQDDRDEHPQCGCSQKSTGRQSQTSSEEVGSLGAERAQRTGGAHLNAEVVAEGVQYKLYLIFVRLWEHRDCSVGVCGSSDRPPEPWQHEHYAAVLGLGHDEAHPFRRVVVGENYVNAAAGADHGGRVLVGHFSQRIAEWPGRIHHDFRICVEHFS